MKNLLFAIVLFSITHAYSQKGIEKISIQFKNITKLEAIHNIEKQTKYRFYFIESWLDRELISGQYNQKSLQFILNSIFKNTDINFYFSVDYKIILTQNNFIYDTLPDDFFGITKIASTIKEKPKPIYYSEKTKLKKTGIETIRIGKENKYSSQNKYILSGYVKNITTHDPIPNLVLSVVNNNINAVTNIDGYYSVKLPAGVNLLELKALGIENFKKKFIIYNDGTYNFNLEENLEL